MNDILKGFLTVLLCAAVPAGIGMGVGAALGGVDGLWIGALIGGIPGLLYGLEAGILLAYDLGTGLGWLALLVDLTWSLPNTLFGLIFGNAIYVFVGSPSRERSRGQGWVVFMPPASKTSGFGVDVLQTLGSVNLGGRGAHEHVHLLQARLFGPTFLPIFGVNYVVNFLLQGLFTITIGAILKAAGARDTAWFRPPGTSVVPGFFGWIYAATLFELWAYATE
jgi:hypothetical protein